MTPADERASGLALWIVGTAVMVGVALATPRSALELTTIGGLLSALGLYLMYCGCCDEFADEFEEEVKESYKNG